MLSISVFCAFFEQSVRSKRVACAGGLVPPFVCLSETTEQMLIKFC